MVQLTNNLSILDEFVNMVSAGMLGIYILSDTPH